MMRTIVCVKGRYKISTMILMMTSNLVDVGFVVRKENLESTQDALMYQTRNETTITPQDE